MCGKCHVHWSCVRPMSPCCHFPGLVFAEYFLRLSWWSGEQSQGMLTLVKAPTLILSVLLLYWNQFLYGIIVWF